MGHSESVSQLLAWVVPRCCDEKKPVQLMAVDCFEAIYLIILAGEGLSPVEFRAVSRIINSNNNRT